MPCSVFLYRLLSNRGQASALDVPLYLAIPQVGSLILKAFDQLEHLLIRKLSNRFFDLYHGLHGQTLPNRRQFSSTVFSFAIKIITQCSTSKEPMGRASWIPCKVNGRNVGCGSVRGRSDIGVVGDSDRDPALIGQAQLHFATAAVR